MPKSEKSGGPYPVYAKKLRRDEVFRLHFDMAIRQERLHR